MSARVDGAFSGDINGGALHGLRSGNGILHVFHGDSYGIQRHRPRDDGLGEKCHESGKDRDEMVIKVRKTGSRTARQVRQRRCQDEVWKVNQRVSEK